MPVEHLEDHQAEAVDVGGRRPTPVREALRSGVEQGASAPRRTEIEVHQVEGRALRVGDDDVLGLDVPSRASKRQPPTTCPRLPVPLNRQPSPSQASYSPTQDRTGRTWTIWTS